MAASSTALERPAPRPAEVPAVPERAATAHAAHGRWRWLRDKRLHRIAAGLFLLVVFGLLAVVASRVEWVDVGRALRRYEAGTLALACALAPCSHALYACYDLIGRAYTGHKLAAWRVMTIAFVSYAFNLSLGNLIGGVGVRMRLYARMGLRTGAVVRVLGLSVVTNWLGYFALAGTLFALQVVQLPRGWNVGTQALSAAGVALVLAALGYVATCALRQARLARSRPRGAVAIGPHGRRATGAGSGQLGRDGGGDVGAAARAGRLSDRAGGAAAGRGGRHRHAGAGGAGRGGGHLRRAAGRGPGPLRGAGRGAGLSRAVLPVSAAGRGRHICRTGCAAGVSASGLPKA